MLLADIGYESGRFWQNDGGTFGRASSFAAAGCAATARLWRDIELQTGLQNALDRNYFLVDGYPEPGRTAYLNLRYRF
jgi:iron complex outermembrane receptor protein